MGFAQTKQNKTKQNKRKKLEMISYGFNRNKINNPEGKKK
jgi:hypothetical protein